ncbi:MAG: glycosyltransferase family 2 protein [Thiolinea sp.]
MSTASNKGYFVRLALIVGTLLYLSFCFLGGIYSGLNHTVAVHFFILLACVLVLRQVLLLLSAWTAGRLYKPEWPQANNWQPTVSILLPAFNEEEVIAPALKSLLSLNHKNYEIIMVDDGSTDKTVEVVKQVIATDNPQKIPVRIIAQSNSGKANALNTGLMHAAGEFIMCVDSDSRVTPDSLRNGLRHFQNPRVAAVAGNVIVANQTNLLTRFQHFEYMISQNFIRAGMALFGVVTVIPGPIGLFRREALAQAEGYNEDKNLFAEDADLSVKLLSLDWLIQSEQQMQAVTEAPDTLNSMLRQRYRWKRGIYQVLHNNFYTLLTAPGMRRPVIAILLLLEGFLFEILGFGVTLFMLTNIIFLGEVQLLIGWLILLFILDLLVLLLVIPPQRYLKWFGIMVLQKFTYTYALQIWGVLSLLDEWRSSEMSWDKVERLGKLQEVSS